MEAKGEDWLAAEEKRIKYEEMDQARDIVNTEKDKRRARLEKERWDEMRRNEREADQEKVERRKGIHLEALRQAKVDAMHRASKKREIARLNVVRGKKINEITEARMRKFRESQYLAQAKAALNPNFTAEKKEGEGEEGEAGEEAEATLTRAQKKENEEFQRTFEFQQRAERRAARAERIKKEEEKQAKLAQLGAKDPTAYEKARIKMWFAEDDERKQRLEKAKADKEVEIEKAQRKKLQENAKRVETFEKMEKVRRQHSREREERRLEGVRSRIQDMAVGAALPMCLSY